MHAHTATLREVAMDMLLARLQALRNAEACEAAGAAVMHSVDATSLLPVCARGPFERIVFNFPHTGSQRVHANRAMLQAFFAACECAFHAVNVRLKADASTLTICGTVLQTILRPP
jgi:Domain of unknown function (DUF2431)